MIFQGLLIEREEQFKEHRAYKQAYDDLAAWLSRSKDKVSAMRQQQQHAVNDNLAIENAIAPLEALLNKQAQAEVLLEQMRTAGQVTIASTSPDGQEIILEEMTALSEKVHALFTGMFIDYHP